MINHRFTFSLIVLCAVLGCMATPNLSHAAEEALASRDTTSSNLEDIVDGSSNPLVLVDDAMTTFTIKLPTMLEDLLRLTESGQVSATLTVGGIDRATTALSIRYRRNSVEI